MPITGIDLRTSNSAAALLRGGRPVDPQCGGVSLGGKAFPSYVAVTVDGRLRLIVLKKSGRRRSGGDFPPFCKSIFRPGNG